MDLRKIEKMIRRELGNAIEKITSLAEDCEGIDTKDQLPEDDEPNLIKTKFVAATDILDADMNKNQVAELLRRAAVNLDAVNYQSPDLKKPQLKELIQKIMDHMKKLEKLGE